MFKSTFSTLALIVVLCVCVCAQTQRPASTSANTEEPAAGAISGSVVNESGQPLAGVTVFVRNLGPSGGARSSITNLEGNFRISGLAPALYNVSASLPAYVSRSTDPTFPGSHYRVGDTVRVELVRGGVITGTVLNSAGEPVIGVRVRASLVRDAKGEPARFSGFAAGERTTDDRGVYRIFGLRPGTYVVNAGGATSSQTFTLNPYDWDVPTYAPSSTRDTAAEVTVRAGEETNADIRYRGEPGHVISGTVKMASSPNLSVTLTVPGNLAATTHTFIMPGSQGFGFYGIPDGEYDLAAQEVKPPPAGGVANLLVSEPRRIVVKGADVTGLELVTRTLGSISGRVVLEPAKVSACEGKRRPLFAETLVSIQRPDKDKNEKDALPYARVFSSFASPDANGNFALPNLMPDKYRLETLFYARYWYLSSISTASTPKIDMAANWATLKWGEQIANVTITLAEGAASVRGKLNAASEADLPSGFGVYLIPAEREKSSDVLRYFVTTVEADGTFAFNNLPPGRYFSIVQPLDEQSSTLTKLRRPEAAELRAKLRRAAETQKKDLELKPCQNLTDFQLSTK